MVRPNHVGLRYFFHAVDRYSLFPDRIGIEHTDQGSAVRDAPNIAAELAKGSELPCSSIVFVSRDGIAKPSSHSRSAHRSAQNAELTRHGTRASCLFPALPPTDKPGCPNRTSADRLIGVRDLGGKREHPPCRRRFDRRRIAGDYATFNRSLAQTNMRKWPRRTARLPIPIERRANTAIGAFAVESTRMAAGEFALGDVTRCSHDRRRPKRGYS